MNFNKKGISTIAIGLLVTVILASLTYVIYKEKKQSVWQQQIQQTLGSKKSGQFEATDKTGKAILFEYQVTNVREQLFSNIMHSATDLLTHAFWPNLKLFVKTNPDIISKKVPNNPYKSLEPFFKNGIELVDWKKVDKELVLIARSYWEKQTEELTNKFPNSIFLFVTAKDASTKESVGFVSYRIDDDDSAGTITLEPLAVVPEAQNRGLGKLLVASIFKIIPTVTHIILSVESENTNAIKAYYSWGFIEFEDQPPYHKLLRYSSEKSNALQKTSQAFKEIPTKTIE